MPPGRRVVAVVDDDPLMVKALERLLRASGFEVAAFESAEAFLALGESGDLACLVLDVSLGGISGIELAHRLAASGHRVPVIFITAVDNEATREEAVEAGCVAFLTKPFPAAALINAVSQAATPSP
jgi:FixJ family two-component response regulator